MQASEKDGTGRKPTDSMHLRYEEFRERVFWWSKKDAQGVSQKDSVDPRDEKSRGRLCKVSW